MIYMRDLPAASLPRSCWGLRNLDLATRGIYRDICFKPLALDHRPAVQMVNTNAMRLASSYLIFIT